MIIRTFRLSFVRTQQRASLPFLTQIYYCQLGGIVNYNLPFTTNENVSISTSHTFRSWVVIFHLRRLMTFLSLSYTIRPDVLIVWMFYSEGQATFQWATQIGIPRGTLEIVIQEVLWSIRGSYSAIWSLPLTNVKWHSDHLPVT